jgi:enamine deaminase RidA (YjgF/YER057c/UK114 family)
VQYGDRKHLFISGTASIDSKGQVVHEGDVCLQTERMWRNVEALLAEGGASFKDIQMAIVYLRDMADYECVRAMFAERMPALPIVFTLAPVCRPKWLIEMECIAAVNSEDERFADF